MIFRRIAPYFSILAVLCFDVIASVGIEGTNFKIIHTTPLYDESFESFNIKKWGTSGLTLVQDDINYVSPGNGNAHLKVTYIPTSRGTKRVTAEVLLEQPVYRAQLSYKVKFGEDFEFVRGGKLHGLGGGELTSGCKAQSKKGWSVRVVWIEGGVPALYVYGQNRTKRCGTAYPVHTGFSFQRNVWHHVRLDVNLNSNPQVNDATVVLSIDGNELSRLEKLQLTGAKDVLIDTFMFSTFHGGSNSTWSPSKRVFAEFDNFVVKGIVELN